MDKPRNGGQWSEARYRSFIKSLLRKGTMKWGPKNEVLKEARVTKGVYHCTVCESNVPVTKVINGKRLRNVQVDHIEPVVNSEYGFDTWDEYIERMFCEKENLRVVCSDCHDQLTASQRLKRNDGQSARKYHPKEESTYRNMMSRCYNPKATGYELYGGKGIKVCDRWKESFWNFYEDMGDRPEDTSLDRIDGNLGYSIDNCRWADQVTQANNKSNNHYISYGGKIWTLEQLAQSKNLLANTLLYRIRRGWSLEEALGDTPRKKPHLSKLTQEEWDEIQALRDDGYTTIELSKMFDIDRSQISRKTQNKKKENNNDE